MNKLLVLVTILATASMAHGFTFGLAESAAPVDLGGATQFTIDITVTLDGAPDLDTVTALGLGSPDQPGVATVGAAGYTNLVTGWASWYIAPAPGYAIGGADSGAGANYDSQWVADGYDLGGFGGNIVADGVIGTIVVDVPNGNLPLQLDVFAADAVDLSFMYYDAPPTGGSIVLTPEPGTALLLLVGALGLIRRR